MPKHGEKKSNLEAIVFDMYGTLVEFRNPEKLHSNAHKVAFRYLKSQGIDVDFEELLRLNVELYNQMLIERQKSGRETNFLVRYSRALKALGFDYPPDSVLVTEALDRYFQYYFKGNYLRPGTKGVLSRLKRRYKLGLLSNFPHPEAYKHLLLKLGISNYFDSLVFSGSFGWAKPSPKIFRESLSQLKVRPQQAVFVGDILDEDILGAKRAGMVAVLLARENKEEKEFGYELGKSGVMPDFTIHDIRELPAILDQIRLATLD